VNIWNSLPDYVVDTDKLDNFKTRIDEFWKHQEVSFNYKLELSGPGSDLEIRSCGHRGAKGGRA